MRIFFLLLVFNSSLFAETPNNGIVMAVADKYTHMTFPSNAFLRLHHKSNIPIEVWHAGDEL